MPFNSETATVAGRKGGKRSKRTKDPATVRNKSMLLKVTETELEMIDAKAADMGLSRVEYIVRAAAAHDTGHNVST